MISLLLSLSLSSASALTLNEAFQSALQKNELVGQSREDVKQAEELLTQATSAIFPTLKFATIYQVQELPTNPLAREFTPESQTTTYLTLTQPLFRGLREFAGRRQRRYNLSSEEQRRLNVLTELYRSVATSYLEVLAKEQDLKNLKEQKVLYAQRVKELLQRTRTGQSQQTEALTAQSQEASVDADIVVLEDALKTARENFAFVTGQPANASLEEEAKDGEAPRLKGLDDYLARVNDRPDIRGAEDRVRAAQAEVSIARGAHWPTADLTGNYYLARPGFLSEINWDVQLKLELPIFEGGLRTSETRAAVSRLREAELELARLKRAASAEIRTLHQSLNLRVAQLAARRRASDLAEKNYQVLQREYRRGLTRNIEVQLGLTEFQQSRRTYDQARYQARLDLIRLDLASSFLPAAIRKEN
ncbi:MAG: TolC family protein [Bdellovibrionales bacterium]|nr:TolC family protein [Bdellovibrionales bacterium]